MDENNPTPASSGGSKMPAIIIGIIIIAIAGGLVWMQFIAAPTASSGTQTTPAGATSGTSTTTGFGSTSSSYTMADVAAHNSPASCWTAINGNVYDVTSWISQHPGGPEHITSLCGTDGSDAFNSQHGTQGTPNAMLATFKIGTLTQ